MANQNTLLPLYQKLWLKHTFSRAMDSLIFLLLLILLSYRVYSISHYSFPWFLATLCESWFTLTWLTTISTKWTPARTTTHLDRLFLRVGELPQVDVFVTTADPVLEPAIITINTVLSLLALDYPANKLACYVSDDGCSPLTFYALVEATKFAKLWVPFCKKYNVQVRAPFRYFSEDATVDKNTDLQEFEQEWSLMKKEYEQLCRKIQNASQKSNPCPLVGEYAVFSKTELKNHPSIIKVIWENKEGLRDGVPHLIYISREKRPQHPHHYKAGAMNVLTRVSALMTNAPYILNVDCDMYVNNPKIAQHALCIFLDSKGEKEVAFVQCPQRFYDTVKDDAYGNQLVALPMYIGGGFAGLQGIIYAGTNCFHRRKVIYGLSPDYDIQNMKKDFGFINGTKSQKKTMQIFGASRGFVESAKHALEEMTFTPNDKLFKSLELKAANQVASCDYEYSTAWGKQVGWLYGSTSEDVLTGLVMHTKGWRSEVCSPDPMAFMGCSPQDNLGQMGQHKRWSSGLFDIFLSSHCPIFGTLFGKLQFRECLAYVWITNWALRSVPEICYALLPAYCIITNSSFLPNKEPGMWIPTSVCVMYNVATLLEHLISGLSARTWWNNQRMGRITTMTSCFFGFLDIVLKRLRISDTVFEITKKDQPSSNDENVGRFIFNKSPIFVPGTAILLIQLTALVISWWRWQQSLLKNERTYGLGEVFCSAYLVLCYLPLLKGLFAKGKYGIPLSTICKAMVLAFLFVQLCNASVAN
ncbi:cellulose synthase-like protein H1 [Glycine soja]|uniref:Cellulose synthase-like protein H1 n=2 Tax=Glycine soja TaxID=3848 RepID=A0A445HSJ9_GLYSO|nr:cellulose synthase-like protein H1 [Glycine soja]RZB76623.1 Cellulose synthase-like protein H1 [Glycine soja]